VNRFVLDASIALAWFIDRPIAPYARRVQQWLLRGDRAVVPSVWRLEVANGLVVAERRGLHTPSDIAFALQNFETVLTQSVEESSHPIPMRRVVVTAGQFRLTAYDAEYLDTARLQNLPLATLDRQLEAAAVQAGVPIVR
jgi:predicted nucleic acid-binding protein